MEDILRKLLVPNTASIAEGTRELKEAFSDVQSGIYELINVLSISSESNLRQYAAILLKRKLRQKSFWLHLSASDRQIFKNGLLNLLSQETQESVRGSLGVLIAQLLSFESSWPELNEFLKAQLLESHNPSFGLSFLSSLLSVSPHHFPFSIYSRILQNSLTSTCRKDVLTTIQILTLYLSSFDDDDDEEQLKAFEKLFPSLLSLLSQFDSKGGDEDLGDKILLEVLSLFYEVFEIRSQILSPYFSDILEFTLALTIKSSLENDLRNKAISLLGHVSKHKKKSLTEELLERIIDVLCSLIRNYDSSETEDCSPSLIASQTLDILALHLPSGKIVKELRKHFLPVFEYVEGSFSSKELLGAFTAIGVTAEGLSHHFVSYSLLSCLKGIEAVLSSEVESLNVKNSAFYALGQLSIYCQPEISSYAEDILPVLLSQMDLAFVRRQSQSQSLFDRLFFALENYAENLEVVKLLPFVPNLLKKLLSYLGVEETAEETKELLLSFLGSISTAIQENILPYFDEILSHLSRFLILPSANQRSQNSLLNQSLVLLGVLLRSVGTSRLSIAEESIKFSLSILDLGTKDPETRKAIFSLFASVSTIGKEGMERFIPQMVDVLLETLNSCEGISIERDDEINNPIFNTLDDDDESNEEDVHSLCQGDGGGSNIRAVNVENVYMEEKQQALLTLVALSTYSPHSFRPFVSSSLPTLVSLLDFPDEDVRKGAAESIGALSSLEPLSCHSILSKLLSLLQTDDEISVVCGAFESVKEILKHISFLDTYDEDKKRLFDLIYQTISSGLHCLKVNMDEGLESDSAYQNKMLFEYAGDVLPAFGKSLGPALFKTVCEKLFPILISRSRDEETLLPFVTGTLAECMIHLKGFLSPFLPPLSSFFQEYLSHSDSDVRNNAVFGLGELMLHGQEDSLSILSSVTSETLLRYREEKDGRVLDQYTGYFSRLLLLVSNSPSSSSSSRFNSNELLALLLSSLPLRSDYEEYLIVFQCLSSYFSHPFLQNHLDSLCQIILQVSEKEIDNIEKLEPLLVNLLSRIPQNVLCSLEPSVAHKLSKLLPSV